MNALTHNEGVALQLPPQPVGAAPQHQGPSATPQAAPRAQRRVWQVLRSPLARAPLGLWLAWSVVALVLLWAIVPGWFSSHDPLVGQAGLS